MDQQNIFYLGFLTITLAISAFILWGPSPRIKKKKDHITGLQNLGATCFLNTLLQALASCAIFIQWLTEQKNENQSLTSSLTQILLMLNGEGNKDTYAPIEVLSALKRHGWVVPSGEQDAHELFHVIVSTLEEENKRMLKFGSLSDALPPPDLLPHLIKSNSDDMDEECYKTDQASSSHSDSYMTPVFSSQIEKENAKLAQGDSGSPNSEDTLQMISENLSPDGEAEEESIKNICGDNEETKALQSECTNSEGDSSFDNKKSGSLTIKNFKISQETLFEKCPGYQGYYDRATEKALLLPQTDSPPFQGLLTSTLQCSLCGYYSSLHYDTFDSLSLPLGDNYHLQVVKLQDLLRRFVKTEIIHDVECEKCCKKTTAFKTMNFGKLPDCLCLHIARTTWQSYSHTPTKRDDYVDFPEYLPMDEYTVSARLKKESSVSSIQSLNSESSDSEKKTYKHMYRLKSVVVHLGDVSSGHFLTYRRGALNTVNRHRMGKLAGAYVDSRRWFMTSDDNVKVSSLAEAMESLAYMLFYEKCSPDMFPLDDECKK